TLPVDAGAQWQTCSDTCNTPIRTWGDTVAECVINKLCPSHTVNWYGGAGPVSRLQLCAVHGHGVRCRQT
ncbi:hypothetical protein ACSLNS_24975, partial [Escherichia coli]